MRFVIGNYIKVSKMDCISVRMLLTTKNNENSKVVLFLLGLKDRQPRDALFANILFFKTLLIFII